MKVYFIGIGGIGVSALARYYSAQGWQIFGSDLKSSEITAELKKLDAKIFINANKIKLISPDLVIYSPAVKNNNPELVAARKLKIKAMSYPQALGELTKKYKTIAVAGAHGKSTTTAMIGLVLVAGKLDPTVIVGTKIKEFNNSNFRFGKSEYLVIEACEYDRSFLNYFPQIAVVTNVEMDHMECYSSDSDLIAAFCKFIGNITAGGDLVVCADDANAVKMISGLKQKQFGIEKYSLDMPEAKILRQNLCLPGEHNIANALAALQVGRRCGISDEIIFKSLFEYRGSWRRFDQREAVVDGKKIKMVFDYGHHPTQIKLTMEAARVKWPKKKIICVFQPHQAWRTYLLFEGFVAAFKKSPLDRIFITDIYQVSGRESAKIAKKINSRKLVDAIDCKKIEYSSRKQIFKKLKSGIAGGEIVLILGAGDIYDLFKRLAK